MAKDEVKFNKKYWYIAKNIKK